MTFLFGTELSDAYEPNSSDIVFPPTNNVPIQPQPQSQLLPPPQRSQQNNTSQPSTLSSHIPSQQDNTYQLQQTQTLQPRQQQALMHHRALMNTQKNNGAASKYLEALGTKKRDMMKLIIMSTMILFAISTHSFVMFLIKEGLAYSEVSFKQEVGLRLLYPLIVVFILWNLKASR